MNRPHELVDRAALLDRAPPRPAASTAARSASVASAVRHRTAASGRAGANRGRRLGTVEAGQPEVHQDDVRRRAARAASAASRPSATEPTISSPSRAVEQQLERRRGTPRCPRRAAPRTAPSSRHLIRPRAAAGSAAGRPRGSRSRPRDGAPRSRSRARRARGSSAPVSSVRISRPPSSSRSATAPATVSKLVAAGDGARRRRARARHPSRTSIPSSGTSRERDRDLAGRDAFERVAPSRSRSPPAPCSGS